MFVCDWLFSVNVCNYHKCLRSTDLFQLMFICDWFISVNVCERTRKIRHWSNDFSNGRSLCLEWTSKRQIILSWFTVAEPLLFLCLWEILIQSSSATFYIFLRLATELPESELRRTLWVYVLWTKDRRNDAILLTGFIVF